MISCCSFRHPTVLGCFIWLTGFILAPYESVEQDSYTNRFAIEVSAADLEQAAHAEIQLWCFDQTPHPKSAYVQDDRWRKFGQFETDANGKALIDIPEHKIGQIVVLVKSRGGQLAGSATIGAVDVYKNATTRIQLSPIRTVSGKVVDYISGEPVRNSRIQPSYRGRDCSGWIQVDEIVLSDSEGRFEFESIGENLTLGFSATADEYHDFRLSRPLVVMSKDKSMAEIRLLSNKSFARKIESARLSLPDFTGVSHQQTFRSLATSFSRQYKILNTTAHKIKNPIERTLYKQNCLPMEYYQEQMWTIALDAESTGVKLDALLWLMKNRRYENSLEDLEFRQKVATDLARHFIKAGLSDVGPGESMMLRIRSFHPQAITALDKIVHNNPDSAIQAWAAQELIFAYSGRGWLFVKPTNTDELKTLQAGLRAHLELVNEKTSSREPGWNDRILAQLASTQLEWLERFGIGGEPPVLVGETVAGESVSTGKFSGKLCLVHFWDSFDLTGFKDIKALAHKHSKNVQLIGIVNGNKELAAAAMRHHDISWPVLWDQHQGMVYRDHALTYDREGLEWGDLKVANLKRYGPFLIDESGRMIASGLSYKDLSSLIDEQVANNN